MVFVKSINGDCLLVVDCQNDFVQGTPHALDGAAECLTKASGCACSSHRSAPNGTVSKPLKC